MKQYVLDESVKEAEESLGLPTQPRPWRALLCLIVLEPIALAALYFGLVGTSAGSVHLSAAASPYVIALSTEAPPRAPAVLTPPREEISAQPEPSSVTRKDGKFFVDLHAVEVATAVAMMSKATGMAVVGSDVLQSYQRRLSARVVASSPLAAWQSVFGDVANFAASCAGRACVVHIVSAADAHPSRSSPSPTAISQVPIPASPVQNAPGYSEDN